MRFLTLGWCNQQTLLERTVIGFVGFVLPVPLFMALLLTSRPHQGLALKLPPAKLLLAAGPIAAFVILPPAGMKDPILCQFRPRTDQRNETPELRRDLHAWVAEPQRTAPAA